MSDMFTQRLQLLEQPDRTALLRTIQRGIEKESLRTDSHGALAQTPHPATLGSALTHSYITTDFSEALLELITPVSSDIEQSLDFLDELHRFVYTTLGDEQLWPASMPCALPGDQQIPLAQYGSSNSAKMKTIYRHGLGLRYGRSMQTIAGIHYNFSLPDALWHELQAADNHQQRLQDYITDAYFGLIRNFKRLSWLLVYLFGASPAVCSSFLQQRDHRLQPLGSDSLYLPYATALRMGDLGYQSSAQQDLAICYNRLDSYVETLLEAITEPHADYVRIGLKKGDDYQQLSTALLQIENEFYSPIRPKRVARPGETPLSALKQRGVEYIEVRALDVNPYLPLGIDAQQMRFLDCFLLYCLLQTSPACDDRDARLFDENLRRVVNRGREPGLPLLRADGECALSEWGLALIEDIEQIASLMDRAHGGERYQQACAAQRAKLNDSSLTPSAQILNAMQQQRQSFFEFARQQAGQFREQFRARPLAECRLHYFQELAKETKAQQLALERSPQADFDDYLADYFQQYQQLLLALNAEQ